MKEAHGFAISFPWYPACTLDLVRGCISAKGAPLKLPEEGVTCSDPGLSRAPGGVLTASMTPFGPLIWSEYCRNKADSSSAEPGC